jgi:hypothetical protein
LLGYHVTWKPKVAGMQQTQLKLDFIPPAFNPLVLQIVHWSLPLVQRFRWQRWLPAQISQIDTVNVATLVDLYHQFQTGKIRLILAFRHCEVDDPLCGLHLFARAIPQLAKRQGIALQPPIHSHFLYDRGMTLWIGDWLGWLFARLGGVPIHRGKSPDWLALKTVRDLLINGQFPLAVAPEGATNGHSERVSPLAAGVAQLGFWCVEDLQKARRTEETIVVPIGIQYHYVQPQWGKLDRLLCQLEKDCGLQGEMPGTDRSAAVYLQRLLRLGEYFLSAMTSFYQQFYHQQFVDGKTSVTDLDGASPESNFTTKLQKLLDLSLRVSEGYFGLEPQGNISERCRRLEEAGWTYIYRQDRNKVRDLSPLERGLADWIAQEASLRMLHMRLVESFVAVTDRYIESKLTFERLAETTLILFDAIARIKNQNRQIPRRPSLGWRQARMTIGTPISITNRWPIYASNRAAAKQAVADLTQDLQQMLEKMIS